MAKHTIALLSKDREVASGFLKSQEEKFAQACQSGMKESEIECVLKASDKDAVKACKGV